MLSLIQDAKRIIGDTSGPELSPSQSKNGTETKSIHNSARHKKGGKVSREIETMIF